MALLCLILFGILQVSYLVAARNVVNYSAVATARAAAVGLNDFMLHKVSHYATIPTAGPIRTPQDFEGARPKGENVGALFSNAISRKKDPRSQQGLYEVGVYEAYHLAGTTRFNQILDYENWQQVDAVQVYNPDEFYADVTYQVEEDAKLDMIHVTVKQGVPLTMPFAKAFFPRSKRVHLRRNRVKELYPAAYMSATVTIEDHSKLYFGNRDE